MIVIHVSVDVKENQVAAFVANNQTFASAASAFAGCEQFKLYRDTRQSSNFTYYQVWTTEADFRAYQQSDAFKQHRLYVGKCATG